MTQAITDENFGAWMLKCNPQTWDLEGFLADGQTFIEAWSVLNNYRSARMRPGEPVVFWVTGPEDANLAPGVWGVGHVIAPVNVEINPVDDEAAGGDNEDGEAPAEDDEGDGDYWLDLGVRARARYFVEVDLPLLESPLTRDLIKATPALAEMELLKRPWMGNPSWLTKHEWAALQELLGENALEPADPADVASWDRDAEIQQPDPNTRRIIETLAVAEVCDTLESDGWKIEDVQGENVGWDLTARRGGEVRHIEVKGRAVARRIVQLTANEVRAAHHEPGWELAVVTDLISKPELSWHSGHDVTASATPITYRAVLD